MTETIQALQNEFARPTSHTLVLGRYFGLIALALEALVIIAVSVGAGIAYHLYLSGHAGNLADYLKVGAAVAVFFFAPQWYHDRYQVTELSSDPAPLQRVFYSWNFAFACALLIAFMAKLTGAYSRGSIILFYGSGIFVLTALRHALGRLVRRGFREGWLVARRILVLGTDSRIRNFQQRYDPRRYGLLIAATEVLPETGDDPSKATVSEHLRLAAQKARALSTPDILVLVPWSETGTIERCMEALMTLPVSIHLGPEPVLDRFSDIRISKIGPAIGLSLARPPLMTFELFVKRAFDLVGALLGLLLVAPLFLVVALMIKLDSPGPVFFLQRRHGFNQKPFRIIKFRTMTTAEDGGVIRQAEINDRRVTQLGRFLRRWSIDELPQLLNVLKGDMSIVGPRPHALAHDHAFERRIARYARRHNVKPGITGWAQVSGLRGPTDTDEKISARVEHDLYYIDNWSVWFDLQIIAMTVLSARAHRNAH